MSNQLKIKVQSQFGVSAHAYATSDIHAKGESLSLLATLIKPEPHWHALDVATGAGHTALLFAPHVARMIASDLTKEMLAKTAELAHQQGLTAVHTQTADAEALPFDDASFDLVTCRLAFHHFPDPRQATSEFVRVLKPGGVLGFTDNVVVPDKKAAGYYNAYEKIRDPSHNWVYPVARLQAMFKQAGLSIEATQQLSKEFEFQTWADRMHVSEIDKAKLLHLMWDIPEALEPLFTPRWGEGTINQQGELLVLADKAEMWFSLWEWVCVARKPG
jgi:ubiquinone/menaquinone biosynthesis C-methylase UbiE